MNKLSSVIEFWYVHAVGEPPQSGAKYTSLREASFGAKLRAHQITKVTYKFSGSTTEVLLKY